MKIRILPAAAALSAAFSMAVTAEDLKIGDPAPKLQTGEWVQGEAVKSFDKDHVYVVEFWATWCGPCRATIPHLDELHEKLKDKGVIFIGQNCWEREEDKVKPFVTEMGEKMSYRVAMDDKSAEKKGYMAVNWMEAAGQNGIPSAFVVGKDGKVAWIGHPAGLNAEILTSVAEGKFDTTKAAEMAAKQKEKEKAARERSQVVSKAVEAKDWDAAIAGLDAWEKAEPERAAMFQIPRLNFTIQKGDSAAVSALAKKIGEGDTGKNPASLNQISWMILTELKEPSKEALGMAVELAEKGLKTAKESKSAKGADAALLDTLARGQFMKGDKEAALKTQEEAIATAKDDDMKKNMEETLASYKEGKLPEPKEARPRPAARKAAPKKTD